MGYTRKVLAEKKLKDKNVFYTNSFRLDLAESWHFHYRNFRLEFSLEEWVEVAKGFIISYLKWWFRKKPGYQPTNREWTTYESHVSPVVGAGKDSVVKGDQLAVELQQYADYIHMHYRNIRLEWTVDEFLEFADNIAKARDEIKSMDIMKDCPKRVGYRHIRQPKYRVTDAKNSGKFEIHDKKAPDIRSRKYAEHKSVVLDEKTGEWKDQVEYKQDIKLMSHQPSLAGRLVRGTARQIAKLLNKIFKFF